MNNYKVIAITGGPCSGKSSMEPHIMEALLKAGFNVLFLPEAATLLNNIGIKPVGGITDSTEFQKLVIRMQKNIEENIKHTELNNNKPTVIICDRGALDGKAYVSGEVWNKTINELNLSEIELYERYDLVIHLVTAAMGAEKAYTLSNNNARSETIEEARKKDEDTKKAYLGHNKVLYVNNSTDFSGKIQKTLDIIFNFLQLSPLGVYQKRFLVLPECINSLKDYNAQYRDIEQHYLSIDSNVEKRIRKISCEGQGCVYYYTEKPLKSSNIGENSERISEETYYKYLSFSSGINIASLKFRRYYFTFKNQYMCIDYYDKLDDICRLEVRTNTKNAEVILPPFIDEVLKESKGVILSNFNIATNNFKIK